MFMRVAKILSHLSKQRLHALCLKRNIDAPRRRKRIVKKLACSYGGDLGCILDDLHHPELIRVACQQLDEGSLELPTHWKQLRADDLRDRLLNHAARPATATVALYSTGEFGIAKKLDTDAFRDDVENARRVTVVSAYYVPKMLKQLLRQCTDVRVLLNGLGGRRLDDQVKELSKLERKLGKMNEKARVRLAFSRGIFHPKLYLFKTTTGWVAWVGSANATAAALDNQSQNEEILLRLEPAPPSLLAYSESVWKNGSRLKDCRPPVNSLPAFFRTGDLYYKPYATNPMTFNPFESLLRGLTDDQRTRLAALNSPDVEPRAGIGAFSIRRSYNHLVQRTSGSGGDDTDESKSRTLFRPCAIETCYGYWVANCFVETVNAELDKASADKDEFLRSLCKWLNGPGRRKTINRYRKYLQDVHDTININEIDPRSEKEKKRWERAFESTDRIEKLIDMLAENLDREVWRERVSRAFVSQRVPEIWDDVVAREAFEGSFFESLAEQSYKSKSKRSRAAGQLLRAIGIEDEATAKDIRDKLKERLTDPDDPDWYRRFADMTGASR